MKNRKVFLIINSYYIGDILLVNPLVQNIKRIYEDAYVVMLTPPQYVDMARYQEGVDEVIVWDRHGKHHGFFNMLKFIKSFPYKVYAAFPIYSGDRSIMLAWLLGSKYILGTPKNIFGMLLKSKNKIVYTYKRSIQGRNVNLLSGITKEDLFNCPMKFNLPVLETPIISDIKNIGDFVVICPTSSNPKKDMNIDNVCSLIEKLNCNVVLLGKGNEALILSNKIKEKNYKNLIDLTDKTTLLESAKIIDMSQSCISVDTGMLHVACTLNKSVIGIFYGKKATIFKPDCAIYPNTRILKNCTTDDILKLLS